MSPASRLCPPKAPASRPMTPVLPSICKGRGDGTVVDLPRTGFEPAREPLIYGFPRSMARRRRTHRMRNLLLSDLGVIKMQHHPHVRCRSTAETRPWCPLPGPAVCRGGSRIVSGFKCGYVAPCFSAQASQRLRYAGLSATCRRSTVKQPRRRGLLAELGRVDRRPFDTEFQGRWDRACRRRRALAPQPRRGLDEGLPRGSQPAHQPEKGAGATVAARAAMTRPVCRSSTRSPAPGCGGPSRSAAAHRKPFGTDGQRKPSSTYHKQRDPARLPAARRSRRRPPAAQVPG